MQTNISLVSIYDDFFQRCGWLNVSSTKEYLLLSVWVNAYAKTGQNCDDERVRKI